jgi:hypothetical protein
VDKGRGDTYKTKISNKQNTAHGETRQRKSIYHEKSDRYHKANLSVYIYRNARLRLYCCSIRTVSGLDKGRGDPSPIRPFMTDISEKKITAGAFA